MCGIFGLINKDGSTVDQDLVHSATRKLAHRGPDGEGFYFNKNVGLGHRRLSIIDLSDGGAQPMHKHDLVIIYNGEIYNYVAIREELLALGYAFHSESDTEVLLSAYDCWGPEMLSRLNGMWAFVIYSLKGKTLFYSRDRYGMKPLYIYETEKILAFASEIKAFSGLPMWTGKLNRHVVSDFLYHGRLHHRTDSLYENVKMVEPASHGEISSQGAVTSESSYYVLPQVADRTFADNIELYKNHFATAVSKHHVSDVPVACALSGGLDSSSIVSQSFHLGQELKTFSYVPHEASYSEKEHIDTVISDFQIKNHRVSPDFTQHIDLHESAILSADAPLLNINYVSAYILYKSVKESGYKVLLAGQGADELLLGYNFYYLPYLKSLPYWKKAREIIALSLAHPAKVLASLIPKKTSASLEEHCNLEKVSSSATSDYYENHLYYGHLHALLQFEDRISMAHGVEGRLPFLDATFSHFLHQVPSDQKIYKASKKHLLRKAMEGITPTSILNRKDKKGFLAPQDLWMYEHRDHFVSEIRRGMSAHPAWIMAEYIEVARKVLASKKYSAFSEVWRVYSFYRFLDMKL